MEKKTSNLDLADFSEQDLPAVTKGIEEPVEKPHVEVSYDLTGDEVRAGLKRFQKSYGRTRNIVYTVLCGFIIAVNLFDMIFRGNTSAFCYLFIGVSLAIIFIIWNAPKRHREQIAKAMEQEHLTFTMCIYEDCIFIRESEGGFRIRFDDASNQVIEMPQQFVVCVGKERIYILPKRCIQKEQEEKILENFSHLGERFVREAKESQAV